VHSFVFFFILCLHIFCLYVCLSVCYTGAVSCYKTNNASAMLWSQSVVGVLATLPVGFSPGLWTWGWYDQFLTLWRLYEFAKSGMLAQTMASTDDVLLGCHHTIYQIRSFCEFIGELRWTILHQSENCNPISHCQNLSSCSCSSWFIVEKWLLNIRRYSGYILQWGVQIYIFL